MLEVTFSLDKSCNWNCSYCNQKKMEKPKKTDDEYVQSFSFWLKEIIDLYKEIDLFLLGGEPGIWSEYLWNGLYDEIEKYDSLIKRVNIFSNGTVFNHPFFKNKQNKKTICLWHCTNNLNSKITMPNNSFFNVKNTFPLIVVEKKDIDLIETFLNNNNEINNIGIEPIQSLNYTDYIEKLTYDDYRKIYNIIKEKDQISEYTKKMFFHINRRLSLIKDPTIECRKQLKMLLVDLAKDVIYRCCNADYEEKLTIENLKLKNQNKLFFNYSCNGCENRDLQVKNLFSF
jgi:organic radical activating enzyme